MNPFRHHDPALWTTLVFLSVSAFCGTPLFWYWNPLLVLLTGALVSAMLEDFWLAGTPNETDLMRYSD